MDVFRAAVESKLQYAALGWSGVCIAEDRVRLNGFLRRCAKLGYRERTASLVEDIFATCNEQLFSKTNCNSLRRVSRWGTKQPVFTCIQQTADRASAYTLLSPSSRRCSKPLLKSLSFGLLNTQSINKKSTSIRSTIMEQEFDVFLITESWHSTSSDVALRRCTPDGYTCIDVPRPVMASSSGSGATGNHCGVAAIISAQLSTRAIKL